MKLSSKILSGFGIVLAIAATLGLIAVVMMSSVAESSTMLADEYVPEVEIAGQLERRSFRTMYDMRAYGYTENKRFYEQGQESYKLVNESMQRAADLSEKAPHLTALKGQLAGLEENIKTYGQLMTRTAEIDARKDAARKKLDTNAAAYMANCVTFLDNQNAAMERDLEERLTKINMATHIVALGSQVRVMNFKAQATGQIDEMRAAADSLSKLDDYLAVIRPITRLQADIERMGTIKTAANGYATAIRSFADELSKGAAADQTKLAHYRQAMDNNAGQYVQVCETFLDGQFEALGKDISERHRKITLANDVIDLGNATRIAAFKSQALRDPDMMAEADANFPKIDAKYAALRQITRLDKDLAAIDNTEAAGNGYRQAMKEYLAAWKENNQVGKQRGETGDAVLAAASDLSEKGSMGAEKIATAARDELGSANTVVIVGLVIAIAIGLTIAYLITVSITKPINRVIESLRTGSRQVASASNQLSTASQNLATGASEQAASLEEVSATMEEMSSMSAQSSQNARRADELSKAASTNARNGENQAQQMAGHINAKLGELSNSINAIKGSTDETADIIKTIDEIAFQTNMLAVNAAVEAARAGEAGKGFAVVAEEVRSLAQRCSEAARNTAALIKQARENTETGVSVASEVEAVIKQSVGEDLAAIFREAIGGADQVTQLLAEVASASDEQAVGIREASQAMRQMDSITQSNAANAEESASASEELAAQSNELDDAVSDLDSLISGNTVRSGGAGSGHMPQRQHGTPTYHGTVPHQAIAAKPRRQREQADPADQAAFADTTEDKVMSQF